MGGEQTDSGTQKDPRDHRNARMHPPHTDTRAARSALERSHEDSHRDDYVLCIIFVIVVLVIMQEGGRVLNLYEYVDFRSLPESARWGDAAVRAMFQVR